MRQQLSTAKYAEVAIEHGHVLMDGLPTQTEAGRDLLLAVALQKTRERISQSRG